MTRSFADKEIEKVWNGAGSRRLPGDIQQVERRKLRMLNSAAALDDLRIPPASRLAALKGNRLGQYSIRINDPWRVCFRWKDAPAALQKLREACINNGNIFAELMNAARVFSLGQITHTLFEVGGQYRRNMQCSASRGTQHVSSHDPQTGSGEASP